MGRGTLGAINRLSILLLGLVDVLLIAIASKVPWLVLVIMILMFVGGATLFVYSLIVMEKYREVFDYEPTVLWGRPSTGKAARSTLMAINGVGLWSLLAGGILLLPLFRIFH